MVTLDWTFNSKCDYLTIFNWINWVPYFIFNNFEIYILTFSVWHLNQHIKMCPEDVHSYQNRFCSTNTFVTHSLIDWLSWSSLTSRSSNHHNLQTTRATELNFWKTVQHASCVTYHLSCVTPHMSNFICFHFFLRKQKL